MITNLPVELQGWVGQVILSPESLPAAVKENLTKHSCGFSVATIQELKDAQRVGYPHSHGWKILPPIGPALP